MGVSGKSSLFSHHPAILNRLHSRYGAPIICSPSGNLSSVNPMGTVIDGNPVRLHGALKAGLPVHSSPSGAGSTVDGHIKQSYFSNSFSSSLIILFLSLWALR